MPDRSQAARAFLTNLKLTIILSEITAQLEAIAAGSRPDAEALAGIRRGIEDIREGNMQELADLDRPEKAATPGG